ncbi:sodium/potassium/calcium exchanger 3 [Patella vulgata]|uniref:sodium/potassium/calcium exchanger 3 n=1 Tax=Patella vulgata TaxID=6465 RepID=UPI0024A853AF|nr:sodium/potassium/calcium exchanger 3 [Patella vulgata]
MCRELVISSNSNLPAFNTATSIAENGDRHRIKRSITLEEEQKNCTPRSVDNFPGNLMSLQDTKDGGVFIHILLSLYLFGALAIICDDYFVPSCEHICTGLKLQEDVAGATFMAAGSSTPEFFTSVVGVFIAQSDVGVGTIVGSAVFNILFIIAICGLFAGMAVQLTWWPLFRDLVFYLLSVLALILVIYDGEVHWYEALIMVIMYIVYIIVMYFNPRLEKRAISAIKAFQDKHPTSNGSKTESTAETQPLLRDDTVSASNSLASRSEETGFCGEVTGLSEDIVDKDIRKVEEINQDKDDEYESPWAIPVGFPSRIFWVAMLPVKVLLYITVPDCRKPGIWRKLFLLTFLSSIIWVAIFSYLMVWMVTIAGDALEIPDTVMGLTFLAAGTSVPDCLASLLVARDGLGDMAVSNSIGSNIFDILMCLGFPWLLETLIVNTGERVVISSAGLTYSSIILLSTVAFLLISIFINKWQVDKKLGLIFLSVYVIVVSISCLFELNIFGDFNDPVCSR